MNVQSHKYEHHRALWESTDNMLNCIFVDLFCVPSKLLNDLI